jgi:hypothetical protein
MTVFMNSLPTATEEGAVVEKLVKRLVDKNYG